MRAVAGRARRRVPLATGGKGCAQPVLDRQRGRRLPAARRSGSPGSCDAAGSPANARYRVHPPHQRQARDSGGHGMPGHRVLQPGQPAPGRHAQCASSRFRCAMAASCAATSRAWPGSSAHTSRSRNRRRPGRALLEQPVHLRREPHGGDMGGDLRLAARRGAVETKYPAIGGAVAGSVPVPMSTSPSAVAKRPATAQRAARRRAAAGRRCGRRAARGREPAGTPLPAGWSCRCRSARTAR